MIKKIKYVFFLLLFIYNSFYLQGQITVNFNPVTDGQTLQGLSFAQVFNSTPDDLKGKIRIKVRSLRDGDAVTVQTPEMDFPPGLSTINGAIFSRSSFNFSRNYIGTQLSQTGKFPEGEYEYCYEVTIDQAKTSTFIGVYDNCFTSDIQPITPLILISPADGDEICNTRPDFTWQSPVPLSIDSRFRLILSEVTAKQTEAEAISFNLPLIDQPNIIGNNLLFPQNLPDLVKGKKYAWQVTIYNNKTILTKSDIWTFIINCNDQVTIPEKESYRELKESEDGNFYVAKKILRFSFANPYNPGDLRYSIVNIATPATEIKGLDKLKMITGINKYDIDLSENSSIKNGQQYILEVLLPNGKELKLRFIYQE